MRGRFGDVLVPVSGIFEAFVLTALVQKYFKRLIEQVSIEKFRLEAFSSFLTNRNAPFYFCKYFFLLFA